MKYFLTLVIGLLVGFYLGVNQTANNDIHQVAGEQASERVSNAKASLADSNNLKTNANAAQKLLTNIQHQQIDQSINGLLYADLTLTQKQEVNSFLHSHLIKLSNQKSWGLLERWLTALNSAGLTSSLYDRLQAQLLLKNGQYQLALEGLMVAHALVTSVAEQRLLMKEAQQIIDLTVARFLKDNSDLSHSVMEAFLVYARQQLPDYTPASLALANLYRDNGDLQKSLDTLAHLPYDEQYSSTVDELQRALETQLFNLSQNQQGIKLIQSGHQYLVNVRVDGIDLKLMIDTGASYTALTNQAVAKLLAGGNALSTKHKSVRVNTANGTTNARLFTLSALELDHARLENLSILEVDMGENSRADGLLGMNFLSQFKFKIDQQNALLFLQ